MQIKSCIYLPWPEAWGFLQREQHSTDWCTECSSQAETKPQERQWRPLARCTKPHPKRSWVWIQLHPKATRNQEEIGYQVSGEQVPFSTSILMWAYPAAVPAEMNSLRSLSLWKSWIQFTSLTSHIQVYNLERKHRQNSHWRCWQSTGPTIPWPKTPSFKSQIY